MKAALADFTFFLINHFLIKINIIVKNLQKLLDSLIIMQLKLVVKMNSF